jgi:prevent-host-death family protein
MAVRRMSTRDARANFSELLGLVYYTKEPVVVERKGKPFAVVISPDQYAMLEKELERSWQTLQQVQEQNADKDPEEVLQDVTEVVETVRQKRHGKRTKTPKSRH